MQVKTNPIPQIIVLITKYAGIRGRFRAAATSKMERFVIIVNGFQPLTVITKRSILDVAAVLGPPLGIFFRSQPLYNF